MRKLFSYIIIAALVLRLALWYSDRRLREEITTIDETTKHWELQIDSIRALRIELERSHTLREEVAAIDSTDNELSQALGSDERTSLRTVNELRNEERRLLHASLGELLQTRAKIDKQLNFLDATIVVLNILLFVIVGALIVILIRGW